jgi:nucleoside phosphorylase
MDGNPDSAQSQNSELSELSEAFSFSLGKKLRIESVNGTPGDVLGFSKENLGGTELSEIVHVDDYQDLCNLVDVELGACKSLNLDAGARIRVRLFTAFCVYQWFEAKVVVGSEKNDNPIVVFRACWFPNQGAEVQPQVAKQAIEGENANMAKMRSDFLANISHELRTPLNAIVGFTDIIKNQLFGPMKNQQYLNYAQLVHDSGQHMMYLVDELLDMSQIEAGTLSMRNTEEIAVKNFLESSLRNFRDQAAESEVAFSFDMNVNSDVITNNRHVVRKMLLHCIKFMLQRASSQSTIRCLLRDYNQESIILTMIAGSCLNSEKNAPTSIAEACMRSEDADISPKTDLQLSLHIARTLAAYAGAEILLSDTEDKTQILSIIFQIRPTNEHFRNLVGKEQADSNQDDVVPERPSGGEARLSS